MVLPLTFHLSNVFTGDNLLFLLRSRTIQLGVVRRMYQFYPGLSKSRESVANLHPSSTKCYTDACTIHAGQVTAAIASNSPEAAWDAYLMAAARPSTTTTLELQRDGWCLNGPLYEGSELTICYRGFEVHVLKSLESSEASRIKQLRNQCGSNTDSHLPLHKNIVQFELWDWQNHGKDRCFMVMPKLPTSLEPISTLAEELVIQLWDEISGALQFLHDHGLACMDVKPSNICITHEKLCVLIDLGSVSPFGQRTQTTPAYVPFDVESKDVRASADHDWWMMGMTLAEKGCGVENRSMGTSGKSMTTTDLRDLLSKHLPTQVFQSWKAKLRL